MRILVVDDDEGMRSMLKTFLTILGHKVTIAEDGQIALDLVEDEQFDLIITDLVMPGCEGVELVDQLQKIESSPIVIAMTGHDAYSPLVKALKVEKILFKPFSIQEVQKLVEYYESKANSPR